MSQSMPLPREELGEELVLQCLAIDLEVGRKDQQIHKFAGVRGDSGAVCAPGKGSLQQRLKALDDFLGPARYLLGHNLLAFDLPHLQAVAPDLQLLALPAIDTLRLNPLAFPRNPYHHLVKHYQDGRLESGHINDPAWDARISLELFESQLRSFRQLRAESPDLLTAWHWLVTADRQGRGFDAVFKDVRGEERPTDESGREALRRLLTQEVPTRDGGPEAGGAIPKTCTTAARQVVDESPSIAWPLAYALAWLSVAGTNSVLPPWVLHQFPDAGRLIRRLRDIGCHDAACGWCSERHDADKELKRLFALPGFRAEPADADGRPLQRSIVEAAMRGEHVLGILPTGTGKSVCYQLPALSRFEKTGALTVVISPLVALMSDQVTGLEARGIHTAATVNGMLSMPERKDVLDRVRLGDVSILVISPEQLRSPALKQVLYSREIGAWVLDEAHCLSKWGHDFRPDYRYVGRFIREHAGERTAPPPILCLTATAKPEVVRDVVDHFRKELNVHLAVFDGGSSRTNLEFEVESTTDGEKFSRILEVLERHLPATRPGGAIVYCATRKQTEAVASFLAEKGIAAGHFHAGLPPETKKDTQAAFIRGDLRVIAATNAFGMGIDKPDVRLVIHADVPGSLENYLQEAGRAGRDRDAASCVLLFAPSDIEKQFRMSARSRLTHGEIKSVLRALRRLERKKHPKADIVATTGEILNEDDEIARDQATDDTRVRTAIAWLEEAKLLKRDENRVQVFPSSLQVASIDDAKAKVASLPAHQQKSLLAIVQTLIRASPTEGISTDVLMEVAGLTSKQLRATMNDLERLGLAKNDLALTAFVHVGVEHSSRKRFEAATALEKAMLAALQELAPDLTAGERSVLRLRSLSQRLRDEGHANALPERIARLLRSVAADGRDEDGSKGSLSLRRLDAECIQIQFQRDWPSLLKTADRRRIGAGEVLALLERKVPPRTRGTDLLAETTLGELMQVVESNLLLKGSKDSNALVDRALMWLHEQEVIRLNKGLAVFRPAMTIRLEQEKRSFTKENFAPLEVHYGAQVRQVHVMAEYAERGLQAITEALRLAADYFRLDEQSFIQRWLKQRASMLEMQTTPQSWHAIVESLDNPTQQAIVTDNREQSNVLVLAGPGSGKTRVLVHRIAYLLRVRREDPRGILALAYNRHAAAQIHRRLRELVGDDANGVSILTCHAFAMRLVGASFANRKGEPDKKQFDRLIADAVRLLNGDDAPPGEADERRDRLLQGFRWIFVDEYQDVGRGEYDLISAIAGRKQTDQDSKRALLVVGDDDQNIYGFAGASVEYIRRFESDYGAKKAFLVENHRSTAHIIAAANAVIAGSADRMKLDHPITIDRRRRRAPPGGEWSTRDPVGQGRVQVLPGGASAKTQAVMAIQELERLASLDSNWDWGRCAVIAREWELLEPLRACCEERGIAAESARERRAPVWRLRETQALLSRIRERGSKTIDAVSLEAQIDEIATTPWTSLLREAIEEFKLELGDHEVPVEHFREWLAEWGQEARGRQKGLLLLTAHRAKGLEFDHVVVLDGGWARAGRGEDADARLRLFYVAMTRARATLTLMHMNAGHPFVDALTDAPWLHRRTQVALPADAGNTLGRRYRTLSLKDVDLGFAGRRGESDPLHRAIAALSPGDRLGLREVEGRREVLAPGGRVVGQLSNGYALPARARFIEGRVHAILVWRREDTDDQYLEHVRCARWEVVVPTLVFEEE